ncbi:MULTISPECIES: hypothetical protein [Rhodococcus]|uniref:Uncharacterized protein n=2 Tax=Nocardiaceae TaxID=85025 RepID=A0ABT4MFR7_9NOCA|nr:MULTISPECIES: hypothetical protein [Rhodococcus]MCZ4519831.1 hypothetical protein [Rhodococcus ruber]MDV6262637.1 hypothetical protein [Rhodococcus yunnanensis]
MTVSVAWLGNRHWCNRYVDLCRTASGSCSISAPLRPNAFSDF